MHADSFDFSNLYTSIPHASLKKALVSLIKEAYKVRDSIFLVVNRCGKAHWSDSPSMAASSRSITEDKLVELVEYLIDNIYINVGNRVFRQRVVFLWVQIVHHYLQTCFCSTMSIAT